MEVTDYPLHFTHFSEFELQIFTLKNWRMSNISNIG